VTPFIARAGRGIVLAAAATLAQAQDVAPGAQAQPQGFNLYSASIAAGYSSSGLMVPLSTGMAPFAPDYYGSGMLSAGYLRTAETKHTALIYDAEYLRRFRYTRADGFLQRLRLFTSRDVRPRWTHYFALRASDSMVDQLLLSPTGFEFSSNNPLEPDQNAAPGEAHAASALIFGVRTLNANVSTGLSFRKSERLRLSFHLGGDRTQGLPTDADPPGGRRALAPQATNASARVEADYIMSPRTNLKVYGDSFRTFSRIGAFYLTNVAVSAERRLSLQWFGSITGGASMIKPVRAPDPSRDRQLYGYNAGASIGRRTRNTSLFAAFASAVGDSYGFGGRYSDSLTLSTSWYHPNRRWGAFATAYGYRMRMPDNTPDLLGWQGLGALVRNLGDHFSVTLSYGYLKSTVAFSGASRYMQGHTVQTTVSWWPHGVVRQMN
jgi:hypothetical protein